MLYPVCPTCGSLLANIQLPYQRDLTELCRKYNVSIELLSRGVIDNDEFNREKKKIIDKYTDEHRYCCRMRLINFSPLVNIVN